MCVPTVTTTTTTTTKRKKTSSASGSSRGSSRRPTLSLSSSSSSPPSQVGGDETAMTTDDDKKIPTTTTTTTTITGDGVLHNDATVDEDVVEDNLIQDITAALLLEESDETTCEDDDSVKKFAEDIDIDLVVEESLGRGDDHDDDDEVVGVGGATLGFLKNVGFVRFKDDENLIQVHQFPKYHYYYGGCGGRRNTYYSTNSFLSSYYGKKGSNESGSSSQDHINHKNCEGCYYNKDILWWSKDELKEIEMDAYLQLEMIVSGSSSADSDNEEEEAEGIEHGGFDGGTIKGGKEKGDNEDQDNQDDVDMEDDDDLSCKLRGLERLLYGLYDDDYSDNKREAIQSMLLHLNNTASSDAAVFAVVHSNNDDDKSSSSTGSNGSNGSKCSSSSDGGGKTVSSTSSCTTIYKDFVLECMTRAKTYAVVDERFVKREQHGITLDDLIILVQNEQLQQLLKNKQRQVELANMRIQQEEEWRLMKSNQQRQRQQQQQTSRTLSLPTTLSMKNLMNNYSCLSSSATRIQQKGEDTERPRRGRSRTSRRPVHRPTSSKVSKSASVTLPLNSKNNKLLEPVELHDDDYMIHEDDKMEPSDTITPPPPPPPTSSPPPPSPTSYSPTPEVMMSSSGHRHQILPPSPTSVIGDMMIGVLSPISSRSTATATKLLDKLTSNATSGSCEQDELGLCVPRLLQEGRLVQTNAQTEQDSSSMNMSKQVSAIYYNYCRQGSSMDFFTDTNRELSLPQNLDWEDFLTE